jgi:shikimate 5-dehydrogenase
VLLDGGRRYGFNTDVFGIVRALREAGVMSVRRGAVIGGGATAASALVAMAELGAAHVRVLVRRPGASELTALGRRLGLMVEEARIDALAHLDDVELVVSTVPGGTDLGVAASDALIGRAALLDVAYDPWPSPIGARWMAADGTVVHGLEMLLHQALLQVRIFLTGDPFAELPDEAAVLDVMRRTL